MSGEVYVAASGSQLNASILDSLYKPMQTAPMNKLGWTADVDLRDGFPRDYLQADLVVVTDPVQTHLRPGSQEVVRYLVEQTISQDSYLGRHFARVPVEFTLDNNVKVYLYHKISDFSFSDLEKLSEYFMSLYPQANELFEERILESIYATESAKHREN